MQFVAHVVPSHAKGSQLRGVGVTQTEFAHVGAEAA
jgi:hypothetical protein